MVPLVIVDPRPVQVAAYIRAVVDRTRTPKLTQTVHGKALVLAWLPRMPTSVQADRARLAADCRDLDPDCLARPGVADVIVDDTSALRITQRDGRAAAEWLRVAR